MGDNGGMNKRKRDDGAGTSGAAKMARVSVDDDDSSAETEVTVSSTEATIAGEGSARQSLVEGDEKNPMPDSANNEASAAAPSSHGRKLKTLNLISKIGAADGGAGTAAQGVMRSSELAGGDVLSSGMILQSATHRAPPNIPSLTFWGVSCRHCGVGTATMGVTPVQQVCICHACRTSVDAVCLVCGLRGFFPCPGCGVGAATRRRHPVLHHCLCEACLNNDHIVCLVCSAGVLGPLGLPPAI